MMALRRMLSSVRGKQNGCKTLDASLVICVVGVLVRNKFCNSVYVVGCGMTASVQCVDFPLVVRDYTINYGYRPLDNKGTVQWVVVLCKESASIRAEVDVPNEFEAYKMAKRFEQFLLDDDSCHLLADLEKIKR